MNLRLHSNSSQTERDLISTMLVDYGHWAIYRRYDLNTISKNVDPVTNEGVEGERWNYDDLPILIRHDPASIRAVAGTMIEKSKIFVDSTVNPKRGDVIIEIYYDGENRDLTPGLVMQMNHREAYTIDEIDPKRGHGGALIFTVCVVKPRFRTY